MQPPSSLLPNSKSSIDQEFYEKPYAVCKECMTSKFKCKSCLDQLILKLRQLRQQHDQAVTQRKKASIQRSYKSIKQVITEQPRRDPEDHEFRLTVLKKTTMPSRILHRKVIEVPLLIPQKQEIIPPLLPRHQHKRVNSTITQPSVFYETDGNNKVAVQTIEVPTVERESIPHQRIDHRARNNRPKINYSKNRQYQSEGMLPAIKLNMVEREAKQEILISKPKRKASQGEKSPVKKIVRPPPNHLTGWQNDPTYEFDIYG